MRRFVCQTALVLALAGPAPAAETNSFLSALESISTDDLRRHVEVLADDTFEGREAGHRGGRAAAGYLGRELERHQLAGAGRGGSYYQSFGRQYRNILGLLKGSDPALQHEVIVLGAHYDHVGYGNSQNSFGPTGYIHNGADDNASGAAGLLETVEAFARLDPPPKRSILFALWDAEEKGLLGSKHWVANPTLPLEHVPIVVNLDMIGRLRQERLEIFGTRTGRGLQRLVSTQNAAPGLLVDFNWQMRPDSDHYPFYSRGIPVLMLHTGLHEDYHRPSDDAERVDVAGTLRVVRLLFGIVHELANRAETPGFRAAARRESPRAKRTLERALPPLASRLGIRWDAAAAPGAGVRVTHISPGSAADRAALRVGDRIVRFAGEEVRAGADLRAAVLAAANPVPVTVERPGEPAPMELGVELGGRPLRLGISWRTDDAEPDTVVLARVMADSPAARAGLKVGDRVYEACGQSFSTSEEFQRLVAAEAGRVELLVERQGRLRTIVLEPRPAGAN